MVPRSAQLQHRKALAAFVEWEWTFSQVEAFVRERGHCDMGEHPAAEWLVRQVQAAAAGKLSEERRQRLAALGVSFEANEQNWLSMLNKVRDYLMRHRVAKTNARIRWLPEPADGDLAVWLLHQRSFYDEDLLQPRQSRSLRALKLVGARNPAGGSSSSSRLTADESRALRSAAAWERRFAELVAYQREHGDCVLPKRWPENQTLANWVRFQRKLNHRNQLSEAHRARLDALGFPWSTRGLQWDKLWHQRFQQICAFKEQHGHTRVPKRHDRVLWHWRHVQREFRRKGMLSEARIARLDAIGFEWEEDEVWGRTWDAPKEEQWDAKLQQLADHISRNGHSRIPKDDVEHQGLRAWLKRQKSDARTGFLRPDRRARLEGLGVILTPGKSSTGENWERNFAALADFRQQHGHTRVTPRENASLAEWRYLQRAHHRKGLLNAERIARLDAISFDWVDPESSSLTQQERWDRQWLRMYEQLVEFHREHGHCHVVAKWQGNPRLADWVQDQRALKCRDGLRLERIARLELLGFLWSTENLENDARWERRFQQIEEFQRQHGHTRSPKTFDKQLWSWRHVQREYRRKGLLSEQRIARLDAIGFEWDEQGKPFAKSREDRWDKQWDRMFEALVAFKNHHGTTHVVAGWKENPALATWVGDQRENHTHGRLRPDRKARLDAIGFLWQPGRPVLDELWERRYSELVAFQQEHGDTRVSKSDDKILWHWRHVQRDFRRKGKLSAERIARLDAIGFTWQDRPTIPSLSQ